MCLAVAQLFRRPSFPLALLQEGIAAHVEVQGEWDELQLQGLKPQSREHGIYHHAEAWCFHLGDTGSVCLIDSVVATGYCIRASGLRPYAPRVTISPKRGLALQDCHTFQEET